MHSVLKSFVHLKMSLNSNIEILQGFELTNEVSLITCASHGITCFCVSVGTKAAGCPSD